MEKLGRSIRTLVINISSIIDQKHLDERTPTRVQEEMDRLDPAWNRDSDLKKRIEPLRKWHGSRLVMNIKLLTKLLTKKDVCAKDSLQSFRTELRKPY